VKRLLRIAFVSLALVACATKELTAPCTDPVITVALSPNDVYVGESKKMAESHLPNSAVVNYVTWSSASPAIATVSASGVVTGVSVGETDVKLTVTCCDGKLAKSATAKVTVRERAKLPTVILVSPDTIRLFVSEKARGSAVVSGEPGINTAVIWTSSNVVVAGVNPNTGEITAIAVGAAKARACAVADMTKCGEVVVLVKEVIVPDAVNVAIKATPISSVFGTKVSVVSSSTGATACMKFSNPTIAGWNGASIPSAVAYDSVALTGLGVGTYTVSRSCNGPGGNSSASTTFLVTNAPLPPAPSPSATITASPSQFMVGGTTTITYSSTNTTACLRSAVPAISGWSGNTAVSGSQVLSGLAVGSYTVTIACAGPGGTATASTTILVTNVAPPPSASPTATISATPSQFAVGGTTSVVWSSTGTTTCAKLANPPTTAWSGVASVSGSQVLSGLAIGTYVVTITCTGPGGTATASTTIVVTAVAPPPPTSILVRFAASKSIVVKGGEVWFSGLAIGAASCSASTSPAFAGWAGPKPFNFSIPVSMDVVPGEYVVSYTCVNGPLSSTASISIFVIEPPIDNPQPGYVHSITITPTITLPLKQGDTFAATVTVVADPGVTTAHECESTNALFVTVVMQPGKCVITILAVPPSGVIPKIIARTIGLARTVGRLLPLEASMLVTVVNVK